MMAAVVAVMVVGVSVAAILGAATTIARAVMIITQLTTAICHD